MTYQEKLLQDYPESVMWGAQRKCPTYYGYEPDSDNCPEGIRSDCSKCWNREMPCQKEPEYGPEIQQIDAELVRLRELVDMELKNAPDVGASKGSIQNGH